MRPRVKFFSSQPKPRFIAPLLLLFLASSFVTILSTTTATSVTSNVEIDAQAKKKTEAEKKAEKKAEKAKAKAKKARQEKRARLNPQISPPPNWPPKGFKESNGIYAKIPTKKELAGLVSARTALFEAIKPCTDVACGSVIVASEDQCLWWEVLSTVTGPKISDSSTITSYGSLTTKVKGSDARQQKVILLISEEPIAAKVRVSNINVTCHRSGEKGKSGNLYLAFPDRG